MVICLLRLKDCFPRGWTSLWCMAGLDWTSNSVCGQSTGPWPLGCTALEHRHTGLQASQITKKYSMLCRSQTCIGASSRSHCKIKTSNVFCVCPWQDQCSWRKYWWEMTLGAGTRVWSSLHLKPVGNTWHYFASLQTESEIQVQIIVSCVYFKHASEELKSLAKKWHQVTNVPSSLDFSLFF